MLHGPLPLFPGSVLPEQYFMIYEVYMYAQLFKIRLLKFKFLVIKVKVPIPVHGLGSIRILFPTAEVPQRGWAWAFVST